MVTVPNGGERRFKLPIQKLHLPNSSIWSRVVSQFYVRDFASAAANTIHFEGDYKRFLLLSSIEILDLAL